MNQPLLGLANLMRRAFACENLEPVAQGLLRCIELNPQDAHALLDLAIVFQLGGAPALGLEFQERALACQQLYRLRESTGRDMLKVLAIASRGLIMDNMPVEFLLEHPSIQLETLYLGEGIPAPSHLPDHDVAIMAVCESDVNQPLLERLGTIGAQWPRPIINAPGRIAQLARDRLANTIGRTRGLELVASERVSRCTLKRSDFFEILAAQSQGCEEWIVRPVDTHAGHGLKRVRAAHELAAYLRKNVAEQYFIAPFINYQSRDGKYRKYRIALIGGAPYPVHMAVSQNWMVHYLNADMLDNSQHRQEEAAFMRTYHHGFGRRHGRALSHIARRIGLDYVVLDCAETQQGNLLLFEADNGAVVHAMDSAELFPYKRPAMQNIFDATLHMLWQRSGRLVRTLAA